MEPEARYTLVGAVLILLVGGLVLTGLWIARFSESGQYKVYTIYFKHHSLSGLQVDSDVTMRGIKVGSVSTWEISQRDIELVKVNIRVSAGTPVKTDTQAVINRNLLTGIANIDLINSSQAAPSLSGYPPNEDYPVIPEGRNELDTLKNSLPEIMERSAVVLARVADFFSDENQKSVSAILHNVENLTQRVSGSDSKVGKALDQISAMAEEVSKLAASIGRRSEALMQSLQNATDSISQDLNRTSKTLSGTLETLENPRALLSGPSAADYGPGEGEKK